jgi:PAS domain S-box-containing protein
MPPVASPAVSHARSWALAIAAAAAATAGTAVTWFWLEPSPSVFFFAAILLATMYAGLESGLVTTALCVPALVRFLGPPYTPPLSTRDLIARLALFIGVATLTAVLIAERRTQQRLRWQAERQFRLIFETAADAIVAMDDANRIVLANPAASKMFGWPQDRLLARSITALLPEDVVAQADSGVVVETVGVRADGSSIPVGVSFVQQAGEGVPVRTAFIRDITSRKEADAARAEQFRRAGLRADITAALASGGTVRAVLQRCAEAMIHSFDAVLARIWVVTGGAAVLTLQASAGLYTHLDGSHSRIAIGALRIGHIAETRAPYVTNDFAHDPRVDDPAWAERESIVAFAGYPLLVEGRVVGVAAVFARRVFSSADSEALASIADAIAQAVERRQAEEAVRRSEAFLAEAEALSHSGSWAWDARTETFFLSQEAYRILGLRPGFPVTLDDVTRLIVAEDRAIFDADVETLGRERRGVEREYRIRLDDGTVKYVHVFGRPADDVAPDVEFVGAVMDVTAQKRAEDELHAAKARLADAMRLSTMGELAASIAHEVNQPLAAVVTNAQACSLLLRSGQPSLDELRDAVADIANAGKRASDVIDRIRLLLTRGTKRVTSVDVNAVIRQVVTLMRRDIAKRDVRVTLELDPGLPTTQADAGLIEQVIINLVTNALDAMDAVSGGLRELTIASSINAEQALEVSVTDTGEGFDPAYAERIFDPFFTTKADGMGMGLAVCRNIVASCGGRLWATTSEFGTTVRFTLPATGSLS